MVAKYIAMPELSLSQRTFLKASWDQEVEAITKLQADKDRHQRAIMQVATGVEGTNPDNQKLLDDWLVDLFQELDESKKRA